MHASLEEGEEGEAMVLVKEEEMYGGEGGS